MERGECKVVGLRGTEWGREMVGIDEQRTVERLRGRLLAEREASKAAREEAELLMKRLTELERLVAEEMRYRDRAEKKLKCALKKLRSIKLVDGLGVSASPFICSSEGEFSPNPVEGEVGDAGLVEPPSIDSSVSGEGSWSTVESSPSVNMASSKHCSRSNSCDCELGTADLESESLKRCKDRDDDERQEREHGSDESNSLNPGGREVVCEDSKTMSNTGGKF